MNKITHLFYFLLEGAFTLYLCFVVPPIYKEFTSTRTRFEFVGKIADSSLPEAIDYFLQTDLTYDSVDFDDPISTISYFTKLCLWFPAQNQEASIQVREEEVNKSFRYAMTRIIKTKDGSIQTTEAQVHHILRSAAEKIHFILREYNQSLIAAELCERELSDTMLEALKSISDVLDNSSDLEIQTYDRPSIS